MLWREHVHVHGTGYCCHVFVIVPQVECFVPVYVGMFTLQAVRLPFFWH